MNKLLLTSAIVLFFGLTAFSQDEANSKKWYKSENAGPSDSYNQDLQYQVHGRYSRPVKQEKLRTAKSISDFIDGYPANWVTAYVSVEILTTFNGKDMKAVSANHILSAEQKNNLNKVDLASDVVVNVKYMYENPVTNIVQDRGMHVAMTLVPDIEAEYTGGYHVMRKYLKENVVNKIAETFPGQFQEGAVIFTVNEEGEIVNAKVSKTSGNTKTDKLFINAINKMPKWKPAQNSNGVKVKQEFEFSIGGGGC